MGTGIPIGKKSLFDDQIFLKFRDIARGRTLTDSSWHGLLFSPRRLSISAVTVHSPPLSGRRPCFPAPATTTEPAAGVAVAFTSAGALTSTGALTGAGALTAGACLPSRLTTAETLKTGPSTA
jgi:hypothetical protein